VGNFHSLCDENEAVFCLFPLHPGPCRRNRRQQQPAATQQSRSVPLRRTVLMSGGGEGERRAPAKKASGTVYGTPAAQRKAQGRATVGAPPAKSAPAKRTGTVYGTPAKKAAKAAKKAAKAAPRKAAPPRSRGAAADAGNAAQMLLSGSGSVDSRRYVQRLMQHVSAAREADARRNDGTTDEYNKMITKAALEIGRVLANEAGGSPVERRRLMGEIANIANDAMRTGDTRQIAALKRRLAGSRTASAYTREDRALALFGLQRVDPSMYGLPAFPLGPIHSFSHLECNLSVFCRNPLHPGPCKGWKGTLAKVAPGALKLIEEERKKKLAAKQKAIAAAKAAASKVVDKAKRGVDVDEHPNAKKKLAKATTAKILGVDEAKVADIEGKTKLSQKEMAWHAGKRADALLAANVAAGNLESKAARQKYRQFARAQILAALQADNETGATGPDSEYQKTIAKLSQGIAVGHAGKHVLGDTDESAELQSAVANAYDAAIQADVKNIQAGKPAINMKKLDKALKEIPGEPGETEHDVAVGQAVGHDYTPPANALPAGALTDEEADSLAKGAEGILKLTTTDPTTVANSKANAKKMAQTEGFADKQAAIINKTASNVAGVAMVQNVDGLDGFSPQGKKKFEKTLVAELEGMLTSGSDTPPAGSLAELVAMRKSGAISADEFHAEVQKKLKIKSKKLEAQKAAATAKPTGDATAPGAAGGGAGAGGLDKNQAAQSMYAEIDKVVYGEPMSPIEAKSLENALKAATTEAERDKVIKDFAAGKAKGAVAQMKAETGAGLNPAQQQALEGVVAAAIEVAMKNPDTAWNAKGLINNLKKKNAKDLEDFAEGVTPKQVQNAPTSTPGTAKLEPPSPATPPSAPAKPSAPAGSLASKATPEEQAGHITGKIAEAYEKLLPGQSPNADALSKSVSSLTQMIKAGANPDDKAADAAKALAKAWLAKKLGTASMPLLHQAALQDALAAEIYQGLTTGEFPKKGYLDSVSNPKGGLTKIKIKGKQAWQNGDGAGFGAKSSMPLLPKKSTKDEKLDAALDEAFGDDDTPTGPSQYNNSHALELKPKLVKHAAMNKTTEGGIAHAGVMAGASQEYEKALAAATSQDDVDAAVNKAAYKIAGAQAGSALGALDLELSDVEPDTLIKLANKLQADWAEALQADADVPAGAAAKLAQVMRDIKTKADEAQKANGFTPDGPAMKQYKAALLAAHVDMLAGDTTPTATAPGGGAGAGGTGTGVNPGAPAASATSKVSAFINKQKAAQAGQPGATPVVDKLTPGSPATAPPTPTPAAPNPTPALAPAGPAPDFKTMKKVGGQKGTNPGGTYETADGTRHYVKQQKTEAHARNEATASALYRAAGINVPGVHVGTGADGLSGTQTASAIVPGATPLNASNLAQHQAAIRRGFAVDAWLGNWDVAGATMDNIVIGEDGQPHRIDVGGSMLFRAQGAPKGAKFGDDVPEFDTLRDPNKNANAAKIFGGMTDAELIASLEQVEAVTPEQIEQIVAAGGMDKKTAATLIKRREALMKKLAALRAKQNQPEADVSGLGEEDTSKSLAEVKLAKTKKKQKILKPQGGYPISQVVVEGHEQSVAEYNAKVNAGLQKKEAAQAPVRMSKFTGSQNKALYNYTTTTGCNQINGHLRAGGGPTPPPSGTGSAGKRVAALDQAFEQARIPTAITTVRGFRGRDDTFGAGWNTNGRSLVGLEYRDPAYSSTSVNMSTARGFAGAGYDPRAVVVRIHMPVGSRAINLGGDGAHGHEAEILLNRGARFRVIADNGFQNGARHLDVELVCEHDDCAE
jgi:hypothetical protein